MIYTNQPDVELALLHLAQLEKRIAEQRERIDHLKAVGVPTGTAEDLLRTFIENRTTVIDFIGRRTAPSNREK